jgi:hypothetical protein
MVREQFPNNIYNIDDEFPCEREHLLIDSAFDNSRFQGALSLWTSLRTPTSLPEKAEFSPHAFDRSVLPFIILLDVERQPMRFRYRLAGTMAETIQNINLTGHYVDQQMPKSLCEVLQADLKEVVRSKSPQHVRLSFTNMSGYPRCLNILRLPLRGNNQKNINQVDHILVLIQFDKISA